MYSDVKTRSTLPEFLLHKRGVGPRGFSVDRGSRQAQVVYGAPGQWRHLGSGLVHSLATCMHTTSKL